MPVDEPELQARLDEILEVNLADDTLAWQLDAAGRVDPGARHRRRSTRTCGCRRSPARASVAAPEPRTLVVGSPLVHPAHAGPPPARCLRSAATTCHLLGHLLLPQGGHPCARRSRSPGFPCSSPSASWPRRAATTTNPPPPTTPRPTADRRRPAGDCPEDEGDVIVSGSSTVQPISSRVGELLEDCGSGVLATVDGPGTGDGFELFCAGETDISDASRPIAEDEVAACEDVRHRLHRAQGRHRRHRGDDQPGQRRSSA